MCCLTTAILQSYTVFANVQFEKSLSKKEEEGKKKEKINDCQSEQMGIKEEKEKQGACESVESCRNLRVLSGGLFSSASLPLRRTSVCSLTRSIMIVEELDSPAAAKPLSVCPSWQGCRRTS